MKTGFFIFMYAMLAISVINTFMLTTVYTKFLCGTAEYFLTVFNARM